MAPDDPVAVVLLLLGSYLLGGVPVGVLIGKAKGVDIRKEGSGNIGATNVLRVLGVKCGLLAFGCDTLKGALPVLVADALGLTGWALYLCGLAAVLGHCYSPYLLFAGGKAVATGLGVLLAFDWPSGLVCFGLWAAITAATRYVSLASMLAYAAAPLVLWLRGHEGAMLATVGLLVLLCIYRHHSNIRRLLKGTESKIGRRAKAEASAEGEEGGK